MTKARLLERLRKLLALTASPNANEAAVARNKASKLMQEHGLSEQEVLDSDSAGRMFEMSMGVEGFSARWKFVLVVLVARAHGCEAVGLRRGKMRKVRVVGMKKDVEKTSKLFVHLLGEIECIVKIECSDPPDEILIEVARGRRRNLRTYLDSFRRGAVMALAERLRAPKKKHTVPEPPPGALALSGEGKPKAKDYVKAKFDPKSGGFLPEDPCDLDDLAFARGYLRAMHIEMPGREEDPS